jgi:hypothetical protein
MCNLLWTHLLQKKTARWNYWAYMAHITTVTCKKDEEDASDEESANGDEVVIS